MLLWPNLLQHVCTSLVQLPTLMHQQPCAVVSWQALVLCDYTELRPLQLLLPDWVHFSLLLPNCVL